MQRLTVIGLTLAMSFSFASPAYSTSATKKFTNCTALNQTYPNGVVATKKLVRLAVRDGYLRPRVDMKIAIANDSLSPDVPYVCPRRATENGPSPSLKPAPQQSTEPNATPQQGSESPTADTSAGYYFEVKDSARRTVALWPQGSINQTQNIEVRVTSPAEIRGRITIGEDGVEYQTNRNKTWSGALEPNQGGVINGIVSVHVNRDFARRPDSKGNIPEGEMRCEIWVNGVVVATHSKPYKKNLGGVNCVVM